MESDDLGWDRTLPDSWFVHKYDPMSSVIDYASARPRGMTNPPMNPEVRALLCRDLIDCGLELVAPEWGRPSRSMQSTSSGQSPQQLLGQSRSAMKSMYSERLRSGQVLKKGSCFSKSAPDLPALKHDKKVLPRHAPWHSYHPRPDMKPAEKLLSNEKERRSVHFADSPPKRTLEDTNGKSSGSATTPTEYIKTPSNARALTAGKKMNLVDSASGRRPSTEVPGIAKRSNGKDSGKEEDNSATLQPKRHVEEDELDNGLRSLRGMSQLHRAAVHDRFRFCCDPSRGQPMVLGKATSNFANPGNWMSDAAYLNKFHNSSIRVVDPSGLEVVKGMPKKKKKNQKVDDIDDLKMSDSGLFVPQYPIDESLKCLRRLRKRYFPNHAEERPHGKTHEEQQKEAADKLKCDLAGVSMLAKIRSHGVPEEEQREMDEAVALSGY
mmetsp:Transcript_105195/g.166049  ORF Transcript_105195/g.166049 Transcript_105195/m.166049 type:complete len:437 (+) Transcript_105195:98-1408(+)|eukprot:CAMPEP_0169350066 /NCGR_PEP_ID=MMETSP1017-20121227/24044_1 /TAXON_ID=342587 /ORGANISM="Karlodinium micrum, Strain CCMP2283" /LENGTH=436 /DNA_ID=CAMNT_0009446229 /DNA_START=92 /DNA_END=1402 /DNA_ORIENTATION=-